jgi:hypothetical protein
LRAKGIGKGTHTIRVTDQDGALFKAEKAWGDAGHRRQSRQQGVRSRHRAARWRDRLQWESVYLAEQGDNGLYTGRLTAADTLELVYVAGEGTAYRAELTRKK